MSLGSVLQDLGIIKFKVVGSTILIEDIYCIIEDSKKRDKFESLKFKLRLKGGLRANYLPRNLISVNDTIRLSLQEDTVCKGLKSEFMEILANKRSLSLGASSFSEFSILDAKLFYDTDLEILSSKETAFRRSVLDNIKVTSLVKPHRVLLHNCSISNSLFVGDTFYSYGSDFNNTTIVADSIKMEIPNKLFCTIRDTDYLRLRATIFQTPIDNTDLNLVNVNSVYIEGFLRGKLSLNSVRTLYVSLDTLKSRAGLQVLGDIDNLYIHDCHDRDLINNTEDIKSHVKSIQGLNYKSIEILTNSVPFL